MKYYDKNNKTSYLKYWEVNNLYGRTMFQTFCVHDFKWVDETFLYNEDFIKIYNNDDKDEGYFLEVYIQYLENLHNLQNDLPFLPEGLKIEKVGKFAANLHNK